MRKACGESQLFQVATSGSLPPARRARNWRRITAGPLPSALINDVPMLDAHH